MLVNGFILSRVSRIDSVTKTPQDNYMWHLIIHFLLRGG
jgi:hypothetical protein